jgi:putative membrane protein
VSEIHSEDTAATAPAAPSPQVIATSLSGRVAHAPPAVITPAVVTDKATPRSNFTIKLGVATLAAAFVCWLGIDTYRWIVTAFDFGAGIGWLAAATAAAAVSGAVLVTARELKGYLALRSVESIQRRLAAPVDRKPAAETRNDIRSVVTMLPKNREAIAAVARFQEQVQSHHSSAQQLEIFSNTVMAPLDRRAEAIVRRASARAFGFTAVSPTALTDALFFIACSMWMVREIATCYGHRPTASATARLLRRLLSEAGKLGAIDLAAASLTQHIGGMVAERVAASAAESVYATQRMARLGLVTMELCRPVPFRPNEVPGIMSSLIGNLLTGRAPQPDDDVPDLPG